MRILFFGSSAYCIPLLESLSAHFSLLAVITQPDKPIGRKKVLTPSAPKQFAVKNNIRVFTPSNKHELLHLKADLSAVALAKADIGVVADYGLIIPEEIFTILKHKTINIHFSRLPQLRGASPVQHTILSGAPSAWITIQRLEKDLDTGDILWQKEYLLTGKETTDSLYSRLFAEAAKELPPVIRDYIAGKIIPIPQDHAKATFTKRLSKDDGFVPWEKIREGLEGKEGAEELERKIRAFSPWPGVWTTIRIMNHESGIMEEKRLKILSAHIEQTTKDKRPKTKLVIDTVQLEGKQPVTWKQFREGHADLFTP